MKIGDKVRFLNEVGGGIVKGFQDKNIILVEDADGFDIPVNIHDCVAVETDNYNIDVHKNGRTAKEQAGESDKESRPTSVRAQLNAPVPDKEEEDEDLRPITFRPDPIERRNADILNACLCFVPVDIQQFSQSDFDAYLVNDSNYFLDFILLTGESKSWQLFFHGTAEPNTKVFMKKISHDTLNGFQHLCFQTFAYKEKKTFLLKPAMSVELNPDLTKFYKLHTFSPNDFFEERVLTFDLIVNNLPAREVYTHEEDIREALIGDFKEKAADRPHIHAIAIKKEQHDDIEVINLHATELLDNTNGMKPSDILDYQLDIFRKKMELYKKKSGKKLIFIHGKGQGVLRNALLRELRHSYHSCTAQDASFREYGFGATMVIIH